MEIDVEGMGAEHVLFVHTGRTAFDYADGLRLGVIGVGVEDGVAGDATYESADEPAGFGVEREAVFIKRTGFFEVIPYHFAERMDLIDWRRLRQGAGTPLGNGQANLGREVVTEERGGISHVQQPAGKLFNRLVLALADLR